MVADVKESLAFNGQEAQQQGLAWRTVDTFDELKQQFGLEGEDAQSATQHGAGVRGSVGDTGARHDLADGGIRRHLHRTAYPGVGAGAFIGAVALLLFFWSKYLHGTAGWLEVLLFVTGFCFVLLEVFVLPGFGIFGLGGGAMMLASLILASLTFVRPHSEVELEELARSVGTVAVSGLGVMAFIVVSRRYLPQAPVFRNIVLEPPRRG